MRMRRAFTLVELSIVLVILGLLVGGVLAGQSLIRAAELRAVTTEFNQYKTALSVFRDKYFSLPGDMPNAVRYWGFQTGTAADGLNADCIALTHTTPSTDSRTCNGDGDGKISTSPNDTNRHESFRAWQHLANAGLVEGSYTGVRGTGGVSHGEIGKNIPRSKLGAGGWSIAFMSEADTAVFPTTYGNILALGAATTMHLTMNPLLKPEEAYNIDMKMDDGKPQSGFLLNRPHGWSFGPNCVAASNDRYALDHPNVACTLYFAIDK